MNIWDTIVSSFARFDIIDAIDILIVAVVIYYLLKIAARSRAIQVLKGLGILLVGTWVSALLRLQSVNWLMNSIINAGPVMIVILFQPEMRKALEQLGRGKILEAIPRANNLEEHETANELIKALLNLSKHRVGALIVVQKDVALGDIIETGVRINARLSASLLETIFTVNTPLHDGAVIISDGVIVAAGCFLPLSDNAAIPKQLGTRHRAAVGMSEQSDSLVFIVSEENGIISLAYEGILRSNLDAPAIRRALLDEEIDQINNGRLKSWLRARRRKSE